jgi:hypothetical protein
MHFCMVLQALTEVYPFFFLACIYNYYCKSHFRQIYTQLRSFDFISKKVETLQMADGGTWVSLFRNICHFLPFVMFLPSLIWNRTILTGCKFVWNGIYNSNYKYMQYVFVANVKINCYEPLYNKHLIFIKDWSQFFFGSWRNKLKNVVHTV